jgi:hypothetical protein
MSLKVDSLLRCRLQSCDQAPKIQQGLPSQNFKQCAPDGGQTISLGGAPAARGTPFLCGNYPFWIVLFLFFLRLFPYEEEEKKYHERGTP